MNIGKINKKTHKTRILVAPLDWGLGHASRCVPVIEMLLSQGAEVIIAAEGPVASLLKKEFPSLTMLPLKGYNIKYSTGKNLFFLKLLSQAPSIKAIIHFEHKWLDQVIEEHKIDGVISDNRFGLYTNKIPCVFITHQLFIQTGYSFLNKMAQRVNYKYINKFNECWVADTGNINNLAGHLSHPKKMPAIPVKYLGILSRFRNDELKKEIDLLVMISGPEPQRSIFEKIILEQINNIKGTVVFLRGLPMAKEDLKNEKKNITIFNHLPSTELNALILRSHVVLARCGYSTIMDLVALKQKAILVPTPGQSEQEYLATYLKEKKYFFTEDQESFSLERSMEKIDQFQFSPLINFSGDAESIIVDWLNKLQTKHSTI